MSAAKKIFFLTGEASGDRYAAELLHELQKSNPDIKAFGVGGPLLKRQGASILVDATQLSIVGFSAVFKGLFRLFKTVRFLKRALRVEKPDLAILIDLPDFNLIMAKALKRQGVPVIYYVSPQVWAWRKKRIHKIKRRVDRMLVLFPFEQEIYRRHGVDVEFVGHPLVETVIERRALREDAEIRSGPRVAVLPGSRISEIAAHAKVINDLSRALRSRYPRISIRLPIAPTLQLHEVKRYFPHSGIDLVNEPATETLAWADSAVIASGTATLEGALVGTPFLILYQMSPINAWLIRRLFRFHGTIGMPNILLGRRAVLEFTQEGATVAGMLSELERLLFVSDYRRQVFGDLITCRRLLGAGGASRRAAASVHRFFLERPVSREAALEPVPTST